MKSAVALGYSLGKTICGFAYGNKACPAPQSRQRTSQSDGPMSRSFDSRMAIGKVLKKHKGRAMFTYPMSYLNTVRYLRTLSSTNCRIHPLTTDVIRDFPVSSIQFYHSSSNKQKLHPNAWQTYCLAHHFFHTPSLHARKQPRKHVRCKDQSSKNH